MKAAEEQRNYRSSRCGLAIASAHLALCMACVRDYLTAEPWVTHEPMHARARTQAYITHTRTHAHTHAHTHTHTHTISLSLSLSLSVLLVHAPQPVKPQRRQPARAPARRRGEA